MVLLKARCNHKVWSCFFKVGLASLTQVDLPPWYGLEVRWLEITVQTDTTQFTTSKSLTTIELQHRCHFGHWRPCLLGCPRRILITVLLVTEKFWGQFLCFQHMLIFILVEKQKGGIGLWFLFPPLCGFLCSCFPCLSLFLSFLFALQLSSRRDGRLRLPHFPWLSCPPAPHFVPHPAFQ